MKKGFTLIELMIVLAIISILLAVIVPACKKKLQTGAEGEVQVEKPPVAVSETALVRTEVNDLGKVNEVVLSGDFCKIRADKLSSPVIIDGNCPLFIEGETAFFGKTAANESLISWVCFDKIEMCMKVR